ncbi:MAG: RidA family protein [Tatlockia sp.]|nr:RidA family protein [Tatlockia sp.]
MNNISKQIFSTGTIWEEIAGFSRAVRVGNHIFIAGTTATSAEGIIDKGDPAKQMHFILERIEQAIVKLGGTLNDVVRTRIYVNNISDWEIVAKIHGEKFRKIRPVNTLIQAKLAGECLVEVEAEAIIQSENNSPTNSA